MVKNTKGGGKNKKQARKYTGARNMGGGGRLRLSEHKDEIYACCSKILGNGMCNVMCEDGKERICVIRKKFRGRGKRDNVVAPGVWLLIGKRDYELSQEGKKDKTDLLEVYSSSHAKKLQQSVTGVKWSLFSGLGSSLDRDNNDDDLEFTDETTMNYEEMMDKLEEENNDSVLEDSEKTKVIYSDDEVDVNDI